MGRIKLGFAPTRRSIFSAPDAVKFANLTRDKFKQMGVDFVDITDINPEGLLYDDNDRIRIAQKFRDAKVDGLFLPHGNFGTEYECGRLAKELNVPVLLWGPRDERPEPDGMRLRDSQCGLFATGKVLRRFQVPFTYMTNCRIDDQEFARGNAYLMQFQSDIADVEVHIPALQELSGMGAAYLAGISIGLYDSNTIFNHIRYTEHKPQMSADERKRRFNGWKRAMDQVRTHE